MLYHFVFILLLCSMDPLLNVHALNAGYTNSDLKTKMARKRQSIKMMTGMNTGYVPEQPTVNGVSSLRVCELPGIDTTGQKDSTAVIQSLIDDVWKTRSSNYSILNSSGVSFLPDLGGTTIDFCGGHYLLESPLTYPSSGGGNIVLSNGALHAGVNFPKFGDRFLLEIDKINNTDKNFRYKYLTMLNMEFDANRIAFGGVKVQQAEEVRFVRCRFIGFTGIGLWSTGIGNELFVDLCWFNEESDQDLCHNNTIKTGTAIQLDNHDHSISNSVIFCTKLGIFANQSGASVFRNLHIYTEGDTEYPYGCIYSYKSSEIRFLEMYFDGCPLFVDDPMLLSVQDSLFLLLEGDGSPGLGPIILAPTQNNTILTGVVIRNNVIGGAPPNRQPLQPRPFVIMNESVYNFAPTGQHVSVGENYATNWSSTYGGLIFRSSSLTKTQYFGGIPKTEFVIDLTNDLLLKNIVHVVYSLREHDIQDSWVSHRIKTIIGNIVTIETNIPATNISITITVGQSIDDNVYMPHK
eukprot:m.47038 g.47038  ORF g.47038 m.47038 type:complete len:520 (+) comp10443_c0_seq1:159-1718(+)